MGALMMKDVDTLILGGTILAMDEKTTTIHDGAIAVDRGKIEAVSVNLSP
jgi:cytosine/adenosine deaminase-related metal-dependent hydrolase